MKEGHVGAVMGAYNRIHDGPPFSPLPSPGQWGSSRAMSSDCGAIQDFFYGTFCDVFEAVGPMAARTERGLCCGTNTGNCQRR